MCAKNATENATPKDAQLAKNSSKETPSLWPIQKNTSIVIASIAPNVTSPWQAKSSVFEMGKRFASTVTNNS